MVGVYDRVFETAPVFRAEKHNTTRHLNEYTSLDFEMGYIDGFEDVMDMETGMLQYVMELLKQGVRKELDILRQDLPDVGRIPAVRFDEAKKLVSENMTGRYATHMTWNRGGTADRPLLQRGIWKRFCVCDPLSV